MAQAAAVCSNEQCKADTHEVISPTAGLRFHDLRHHAITELAEGQASEQTIRSIAGHVSQKMLEHYSHIRLDAKRTASTRSLGRVEGQVMSQTTPQKGLKAAKRTRNLLKRLVDETGIEPATSSLRTRRSPS
jgi:Phage integrase family